MSEMTFQQACDAAAGHLRTGRLDLAFPLALKLVQAAPNSSMSLAIRDSLVQAFARYGQAAMGRNRIEEGAEAFRRCVALEPTSPVHQNNLGIAHARLGRYEQAAACFRQALASSPTDIQSLANLGSALLQWGKIDLAVEVFQQALSLFPNHPTILINLGTAHLSRHDFGVAEEFFSRVIALKPDYSDAWFNRGIAREKLSRTEEAIADYEQSIRLDPAKYDAHYNLASIYLNRGDHDRAIECFMRVLKANPEHSIAWQNMGVAHYKKKEQEKAMRCFMRSLDVNPNDPEVRNNLANSLKDQGMLEMAKREYLTALEIDVRRSDIFSNYIFALQADPNTTLEREMEQRKLWAARHEATLKVNPARFPSARPEKLRVGFVSPDFRTHPVGRFMVPLLSNLDKKRFFIACYSDGPERDGVTERLRSQADLWVDSSTLGHDVLDERIRADGIHILVDLAAHTAGNRLMTFARKPAPLQITWLAYCGSTGLDAMDCRFSDPYMDPPGMFEKYYSEKTLRLPTTYWCYPRPEHNLEVSPPPCLNRGYVTFGCLNYFCKISPGARECWMEILKRTGDSRLLVLAGEGTFRDRFVADFVRGGIDANRIGFVPYQPAERYFQTYNQIDIALDPFPYNGGTTTCDGLWMGTPAVTLEGDRPMGRAGLSILSNLGMDQWIAKDAGQYVELAAKMAGDTGRLVVLRETMRERMLSSPLMDAARFGKDFSDLLERAWNETAEGKI